MQSRRIGYVVGAALVVGGLAYLGVRTGGGLIRPPLVLGLLSGLALIVVARVSSYLPLGPRMRRWSLGICTVACVAEAKLGLDAVTGLVRAIDPLAGSLAGSAAAAFGLLAIGVAGLLVLGGLFRPQPPPTARPADRPASRPASGGGQPAGRGSPR